LNRAGKPAAVPFYRWTGGDPNGFAVAHVDLANNAARYRVLCAASASAGYFSVGSTFIDSVLPAGRFGSVAVDEGFGVLSESRFSAPGLDVGLIGTVQFQYRASTYN
jgi:hypothetical protein